MEAQRVPDHEVLVQNLAVLLRPARKTLARRRLVRKASGRVDLPVPLRRRGFWDRRGSRARSGAGLFMRTGYINI